MTELRGSVQAFRALNHNALHSLRFQIRGGGLACGEVEANMKEFDRRCRAVAEMERTRNLQNLQNQQMKE